MKDIETGEDVAQLIDSFYKKVITDPLIGRFFTEVVQLSWEEHIPVIVSFWSTILLDEGSYKGNPMLRHIEINRLSPLEPQHFERWLMIWEATVSKNFSGEKAALAIQRAKGIAYVMQMKIKSNLG